MYYSKNYRKWILKYPGHHVKENNVVTNQCILTKYTLSGSLRKEELQR